MRLICSWFVVAFVGSAFGQHNPHFWGDREGIVHLFEWKYSDIADECERFLAPNGFAGVQVSPVNENVVAGNRPWWERYQPISYILTTRSGNEGDFRNMVARCNAVGVRIYVDIILNHMAAPNDVIYGTHGSPANPGYHDFPAVPFSREHFNEPCAINDYNNIYEVRNCELVGLRDLNQGNEYVRGKLVEFLNNIVEIGVAGFRVDAAKHMWPGDIEIILNRVRNLNPAHGFPADGRPFVFQEVIDLGGEAISKYEYTHIGTVTEFRFSSEIGYAFRGNNALRWLVNWGPEWGLLPSQDALVFVDNHDNQRGHGAGGDSILTHKDGKHYRMATAFALSHPYGIKRLMSSFHFDNSDQGPPTDGNGNILSPSINSDGSCGNGWACEHRWHQITSMIGFMNEVRGTSITNWWDNQNNQIAFCRGNRGFIAFNNDGYTLGETLQTCLPAGVYCDIISGVNAGTHCTGLQLEVDFNGYGFVLLSETAFDGVIAFHTGSQSRLH